MSNLLSKLTKQDLQRAMTLLEARERAVAERATLEGKIAEYDRQLAEIESGKPAKPKAQRTESTRRRGELKDLVVATLKEAGAEGIASKDLALKLGVDAGRLSVWFASTGKRLPQIQRLDRGRYAWREAAAA